MKWRDVYASRLAKEAYDAQRPTVEQPPAIAKALRKEPQIDINDEEIYSGPYTSHMPAYEFKIGEHIDPSSPFLLDLLADQPVKSTSRPKQAPAAPAKISATVSSAMRNNEWC